MTSPSTRVTSAKPCQSTRPCCSTGDSSTPHQIAPSASVTTTAGTASNAVMPSDSASAPLDSAPTMTPSSRPATSRPAAPRTRDSEPRVRRWMIATSMGSHTT